MSLCLRMPSLKIDLSVNPECSNAVGVSSAAEINLLSVEHLRCTDDNSKVFNSLRATFSLQMPRPREHVCFVLLPAGSRFYLCVFVAGFDVILHLVSINVQNMTILYQSICQFVLKMAYVYLIQTSTHLKN